MTPVLVAGIGNIFHGDDGFGVAVAALLGRRPLPAGVTVKDFGIRGLDLTYALLDGYAAAILVDAAARGEPPGTLYVIEPEVAAAGPAPEDLLLSPHELDPARVLRLARALGGECRRVVVVACEPASLGDAEWGALGLTPPVAAAVAPAADLVEQLIRQLIAEENPPWTPATRRTPNPAIPESRAAIRSKPGE
ncbi:MAG TPA: hydrogenase maturation protease [Stellaceae bacterium]|jgi:hydrogenase maturation protease|nr:hydrogenase maturation protease [Stellaceae bacterium]